MTSTDPTAEAWRLRLLDYIDTTERYLDDVDSLAFVVTLDDDGEVVTTWDDDWSPDRLAPLLSDPPARPAPRRAGTSSSSSSTPNA